MTDKLYAIQFDHGGREPAYFARREGKFIVTCSKGGCLTAQGTFEMVPQTWRDWAKAEQFNSTLVGPGKVVLF